MINQLGRRNLEQVITNLRMEQTDMDYLNSEAMIKAAERALKGYIDLQGQVAAYREKDRNLTIIIKGALIDDQNNTP